jgi:uncharacterized protein (DUF58 family)
VSTSFPAVRCRAERTATVIGGVAGNAWPAVARWGSRLFRPRHTIWPTRDGWWCLLAAMGLGLAAVNTGNNLVYLLCSMLLALIVVSGVLSEQSLRGLEVRSVLPEEITARRPAVFGAFVVNRKRWLASHALSIEVLGPRGVERVLHVPRLEAGAERLLTWEGVLPARGRRRLPGIRFMTRFPFGLFVKTGRPLLEAEVLVYPATGPVPPQLLRQVGGDGDAVTRRRGRGHDLYDLRPYRAGDDRRLIHWRSTAKTGTLTIRELEDDAALDARIVLDGTGARDAERLEGGLSDAASLATHLTRTGAAVELWGPGVHVPLARGRGQLRRVLTALALYDPAGAPAPDGAPSASAVPGARLREIHVALD